MLKNISSKTAAAMLGAACACFLTVGCSSQQIKEEVPDKPPMVLYQETQSIIDGGDFTEAIKYLETMDARYPYGPLSEQIQLDLIYAYYKNGDNEKAVAACDDFIRTHPTHQNLDYVYYMRGLTNMQQDSDLLQTIFHIDRYDRDPAFSQTAFSDFNTLVTAYPDSVYAADAQARMIYLRDKLARHYVDVADYYYRRQAYIGAANRCKEILENFYETKYTEDAIEIMIKSYHKLGLTDLEERSRELMADNFPNNSYASKSAFK
ncbi:MAG: outer membrane protein assembly factor BamD [Succinivibrionaceae bacterium]|jgi:outer membrane protein assembly factor BamD|nr:outer membrane protein assembly factor BamD [Pseudomonadota bacterium]MDY6273825.1 outer membrane protein assembly factor BamD [Succinivibrionaceae bacterium]MDY6336987.1 outer membrane protein assembly factor BamD [Succinivibrionaceae bacterium]